MEAVVEADADKGAGAGGGFGHGIEFGGAAGSGFFDEDVFPGGGGFGGDEGEMIVNGGDEDRIHVIAADGFVPVGGRDGTGGSGGQARGALDFEIAADGDCARWEGGGAFPSD